MIQENALLYVTDERLCAASCTRLANIPPLTCLLMPGQRPAHELCWNETDLH